MGKLLGVTCLTACAQEVSASAVRNDSHELDFSASLNREQARSHKMSGPALKVYGLATCHTPPLPSPVFSPGLLSPAKVYSGLSL